ncbi:single-stranded-DNA-specific exonuclease RecJ [Gordoniibacillus kamchatkensis]|uniref:single-stranded-DNA-specific exonuclease RecJ n=1 Tax=Gordoniibacillus kamchatkensis TaxID=1590651 RepID=UPI0006982778|nr:single-stranded-DNA-specific exonuclease RecJ [Paenibacillus sp. VKM B-2647]
MLESKARWLVGEADEAAAEAICAALGVGPLIARLLVQRGIGSPEAATLFLQGGKDDFHDPYLLDGMQPAVERIRKALDSGEKIRIYGDYDADGVSSTSLMVHLMKQLGANFDTYIPHRVREGYGLNDAAADHAKSSGVSLIVTVDTGISAVEQVAYIRTLGMDVIVTDHHEPPEILPDALAVINPKKPGCPYPFKHLAGVGVALKLAHALLGRLPEELLEIAAIGTVADLMPLTGENRLIVKLGLERMRATAYPGIAALLDVADIDRKEVSAGHIGFAIGPRINASGRLEAADAAVKLLTAGDAAEAQQLAGELDALNKERQRIVEEMTKEAMQMASEQHEQGRLAIVLAKEGWNVGVIGIVASRVTETFYRPTVILGIDAETGMAKGSARSISGFDLYEALTHCSEWLDHYGGHQGAAGMSLHQGRIAAFAAKLDELARCWLQPDDFVPVAKAELACSLSDVTVPLIEQLNKLAPFGMGNPMPRFLFKELRMEEQRLIGKDKQHLKLTVTQDGMEGGAAVDAVGFGKGALLAAMSATARLDAIGEVSINEWNGRRKPQLILHDLRIPHVQVFDWRGAGQRLESKLQETAAAGLKPAIVLLQARDVFGGMPAGVPVWRYEAAIGRLAPWNEPASAGEPDPSSLSDVVLYDMPHRLDTLSAVLSQLRGVKRCYVVWHDDPSEALGAMPGRDMFKAVYATLLQQTAGGAAPPREVRELSRRTGLSPHMVQFILRVFEELGFVRAAGSDAYAAVPSPAKRDLASSRLYQERQLQEEAERFCTYASTKELEAWIVARLGAGSAASGAAEPLLDAKTKSTDSAWEEVI